MAKEEKIIVPQIDGKLNAHFLKMPKSIEGASGIEINGRLIKSLAFTTDVAVICNCNADALFCVYPFTPRPTINESIIKISAFPVFCGVGGGTTMGIRTVTLAKSAEAQGAIGVVLNAPVSDLNLLAVSNAVDIPVVITVANDKTNIQGRLDCGATIINVACGAQTPQVVRKIRAEFPDVPIMASGGKSDRSIRETINAGANAITYTMPSSKDLFRELMDEYRA